MAGTRVVILLGGNMGDPKAALDPAERAIGERIGTVLARSRDHWSPPWGFIDERLFLNRALLVRSGMSPGSLMGECLRIEREQGRVRPADGAMEARPIDIDILAVENEVIDTPTLIVPHPRLEQRRFALAPMADVWPSWPHPRSGLTVLQLLDDLRT
jgi:2-amino-4-hydroxy-6-hydroxymethyldihydropteridine diphosphokinase